MRPASLPNFFLPAQLTPLIDRTDELATIRQYLVEGNVRLLTLTGPAGVGKTRLALAAAVADSVAVHFADGVIVIDLAPIREPSLVLPTIARSLGLTDTGQPPLDERLRTVLRERAAMLLVLDNFEQVLPAGALLADLLASCPGLTLLVTSRKPLQLRSEQTLRLAPLPVPDLRAALPPLDALLAVPSVALFVERAQARRADFVLSEKQAPLLAQLAVGLDGLPLALELAAARLDVLSLPTLARRLGDRLRLLASEAPDLPARQQSLEAAVGWSYDLLSAPERRLFRCLGVFVGRVTLDAITAVASEVGAGKAGDAAVGADADDGEAQDRWEAWEAGRTLHGLLSLAERSLVLPLPTRLEEPGGLPGQSGQRVHHDQPQGLEEAEEEEDPEPAFAMLETVREYAWERLAAAGELAAAQRAHAYYFLALAEHADSLLRGRAQRAWYLRLEREQDNLRAALRWLLDQDGSDGLGAAAEHEAGLRLAGALGWFWLMRGYHAEGWRWLAEALACAPRGAGGDLGVRTRALLAAGPLLTMQREFAQAQAVLEEGLALAQQRQDATVTAQALTYLGLRAVVDGDLAAALRALAEARARWEDLGERFYLGFTLNLLGAVAFAHGEYAQAEAFEAAALEQHAAAGDQREAGITHINFAVVAWQRGDLLHAASHLRAGLHTSTALQDHWLLAQGVRAVLGLTGEHADPGRQVRLLGAADTLSQVTGGTLGAYERLPAYPSIAALRARLEREGWDAAYREGQRLPLADIATLALTLVDETVQIQAQSRSVPQPVAPGSVRQQEQLSQHSDWGPLSAREAEVLRLVAEGLSSKAIGRQLFIAPSTVNYHLTSIFNKLAVDTRAQAVAVAAQRDLL